MEITPIPTLDFETFGIQQRPDYPPKPVGLAVRDVWGSKRYIRWGHPTGNNGTREEARNVLVECWDKPMLFQNAAFDVSVAVKEFDLPWPKDPVMVEDTMFLLYLENPHALTLSLKPSAKRILGIDPTEADTLERWICSHIPGINKKDNPWGAHIAEAPGDLVEPYAIGDVDRTWALYEHLLPLIDREGMMNAYRREQRLMPILESASSYGIRVNTELLEHDLLKVYEPALLRAEDWIRKRLQSPGMEMTPEGLADALEAAGIVRPEEWIRTPKSGKRSVSAENVVAVVKEPTILKYVLYRNALAQCLSTFMRKWHALAHRCGRIHPSWNSVRGDRGNGNGKQFGTKTGRLSSSAPNFQNISNEYPQEVPEGFPALPLMRKYLIPEKGHVWLKRDFSSQEMRLLAHFEDGALQAAYRQNPKLDPHKFAQQVIQDTSGLVLERRATKITAFALQYGAGVQHISDMLGVPYEHAAMLKDAYLSAFPDVRDLKEDVKRRAQRGLPVRTWGGRMIYKEPNPARDLSYKMLNHLIQGSSADLTKESIVVYNDMMKSVASLAYFLMTVHDENCASAPSEMRVQEMQYLREAMDNLPLDVPLASEGFWGENYHELQEME